MGLGQLSVIEAPGGRSARARVSRGASEGSVRTLFHQFAPEMRLYWRVRGRRRRPRLWCA